MKNIELSIPDMQSAHCQSRVKGAVNGIEGINIRNIEAGKLLVSVENDGVTTQLVSAIEKAGYKVATGNSDNSAGCSTGCCA